MAEKDKHSSNNRSPRKYQITDAAEQAIISLKDALVKEANTNRQQEGCEDKWNRIIGFATLIFVILTTGGIFWQGTIFHNTDVTLKESMVTDQRAYVSVESAKIEELKAIPGKGVVIIYQIKNLGKTPVYNLRQQLFIGFKNPPVPTYEGLPWATTAELAYFSPIATLAIEGPGLSQPQVDMAKTATISSRNERLYFIGRMTYRDVFNEPRWTDFCFMYAGRSDLQMNVCDYLNEADQKGKSRSPDNAARDLRFIQPRVVSPAHIELTPQFSKPP